MNNGLSPERIETFRAEIFSYYRSHIRDLPWRKTDNPYRIFVSEMMLQQTQAKRVVVKYERFICAFPDFPSLANATPRDVLEIWQGLGYNRRALCLIRVARAVIDTFDGELPSDPGILVSLPGIGPATASEIAAFAFRQPVVFIETNIRRVYIHFFFGNRRNIRDTELFPFIEATLDRGNPREWYYALMDYGVMLKGVYPNPNVRSAHYRKQSPFHGSNRQIRGKILRCVAGFPGMTMEEISGSIGTDLETVARNLSELAKEGFFQEENGRYSIR